eukprot:6187860-Pleurochrysis_carterae.AAC.1
MVHLRNAALRSDMAGLQRHTRPALGRTALCAPEQPCLHRSHDPRRSQGCACRPALVDASCCSEMLGGYGTAAQRVVSAIESGPTFKRSLDCHSATLRPRASPTRHAQRGRCSGSPRRLGRHRHPARYGLDTV